MTTWGDLYPEQYEYKYPKAGEANSLVSVFTYNVQTTKITKMDVGSENDQYLPRIQWTADMNTLAILRMNRLQNKLEILLNNATDGSAKLIYTETNKYYIDITDDIQFLSNNQFVITSEKDGFNHIYLYVIFFKTSESINSFMLINRFSADFNGFNIIVAVYF